MKKVVVLGAGLVGKTMAIDLSCNYKVTCIDNNQANLDAIDPKFGIYTLQADFRDYEKINGLISDNELVIGAAPGYLGFELLRNIINLGKDVVDISFFPEDLFELDELAKSKNVTAIVDCGVAPGMPNIIAGYHNQNMQIDTFEYMVGGLPYLRQMPFQYKAPFSPADVLEEYTRPARMVENGNIVVKPALSDPEFIEVEKIGTLEAFNSDGLRSLITTFKNIPNMREKTLRYPGHRDRIKVLIETGFLSSTPIMIEGIKVRPIDLTSKLLFDNWKLNENDMEFTVMNVKIIGEEKGIKKEIIYKLFDTYDKMTHSTSMARTTGYTATAAAQLVLSGKYKEKGIIPPEYLGKEEKCFNEIMEYLKARNVKYIKEERTL